MHEERAVELLWERHTPTKQLANEWASNLGQPNHMLGQDHYHLYGLGFLISRRLKTSLWLQICRQAVATRCKWRYWHNVLMLEVASRACIISTICSVLQIIAAPSFVIGCVCDKLIIKILWLNLSITGYMLHPGSCQYPRSTIPIETQIDMRSHCH